MNFYNELMLGVGIGIGIGGIGGFMAVYSQRKDHRIELMKNFVEARQFLLDRVVEETNCANALVLKIHNGGGKLDEGQDWYSSVVAESPERRRVSIIDDWQNIPVQESYKAIIREIRDRKVNYLYTHLMPAGDLRTAYEAMGIIGSVVMEMYSDDYYYYYMSFPVRENWDQFTLSVDQHFVKSTVIQMQRKYEKYSAFDILKFDNLN